MHHQQSRLRAAVWWCIPDNPVTRLLMCAGKLVPGYIKGLFLTHTIPMRRRKNCEELVSDGCCGCA